MKKNKLLELNLDTKVKKYIAPSILSADFSKLGEEVKNVTNAGADWIHIDVMDGHFVPNITVGPMVVESIKKSTNLPLDVHLMIKNPDYFIEDFIAAGAKSITIHQEAVPHLHRSVSAIKEMDAKSGVAINPATPVETLIEILPYVDLVLIMTVNPGFGGQKFINNCLQKIEKLNSIRKEKKYNFLIEVDGGVSEKNATVLSKAGCDIFVAGSAIFNSQNYNTSLEKIRSKL